MCQKYFLKNPGQNPRMFWWNHIYTAAFLQLPPNTSPPTFGQISTISRAVTAKGQVNAAPRYVPKEAQMSTKGRTGILVFLQRTESLSRQKSKQKKAVKGPIICLIQRGNVFLNRQQGPSSKGILLKASSQFLYPFCSSLGKVLSAQQALDTMSTSTPVGDDTTAAERIVATFLYQLYSNPPKLADHPELNCLRTATCDAIDRAPVATPSCILLLRPEVNDSRLRVYLMKVRHCQYPIGGSQCCSIALAW